MSEEIVNQEVAEETTETTEGEVTSKRARKLSKSIEGNVITISAIGGEKGEMKFDASELPEEIQKALITFGLNHKLGDAAAGREGKDAEEAILKVYEGLMKGEWTTRTPAAPKVSMNTIKDNLAKMAPEEAEKARALMAAMGIAI